MGVIYKGYSVNFEKFWNYYRGTVRKDYSNSYGNLFVRCFTGVMKENRYPQGLHSNTVDLVERDLNKICAKVRTEMLSEAVPAPAVKSLIDYFKKWFRSYYGD